MRVLTILSRWKVIVLFSIILVHATEGPIRKRSEDDPEEDQPKREERIMGGRKTNVEKYTYVVSIQRKFSHGFNHYCAGTLYSENVVLTASHCCYDTERKIVLPAYVLRVFVGTTHSILLSSAEVHRVEEVHPHEDFVVGDLSTVSKDICLLELTKPVTLIENVTSLAPLATREMYGTAGSPYTHWGGIECETVGWGKTEKEDRPVDVLREVKVPLISGQECLDKLGRDAVPFGGETICSYKKSSGSCRGDAGGPLVCHGTQIGVASGRFGCAEDDRPDLWTRVDLHIPWIESVASTYIEEGAREEHTTVAAPVEVTDTQPAEKDKPKNRRVGGGGGGGGGFGSGQKNLLNHLPIFKIVFVLHFI